MSGGGRLCVGTGVGEFDSAQRVRIWFRDEGAGSDAADLKELFSPFYTTKTGGTGLGLAVTQKIIEAHRGEIYAIKNDKKGLTFVVEIPRDLQKGAI